MGSGSRRDPVRNWRRAEGGGGAGKRAHETGTTVVVGRRRRRGKRVDKWSPHKAGEYGGYVAVQKVVGEEVR
jgi:hypothetical protein